MRNKSFLLLILICILVLTQTSTVLASYSYSYGRSDLSDSDDYNRYINDCFSRLGLTRSTYYGTSFSETNFLNNANDGNAVFYNTHGSADSVWDNGTNYIYTSEVNSKRLGDWKRLVFNNSCYSRVNSGWAAAWGIRTGDGDLHTYIGWTTTITTANNYRTFVYDVYNLISYNKTVAYSLEYASWATGLKNYAIDGNPNWSY